MQLSKKQEKFDQFFAEFLKFTKILKVLKKKMTLIADGFPKSKRQKIWLVKCQKALFQNTLQQSTCSRVPNTA